jgi:hypothetical protein
MQYKIFYTDVPLPPGRLKPDLSRLMPLVQDTRDAAIGTACALLARGAIVWRIEGPEKEMSREDVEREWKLRR